jgi:hypothetical protein
MRAIIGSIEAEFRRAKTTAERAIAQLSDDQLHARGRPSDNSIAVILAHVAGNLASRFTDFKTSDGEKPWRRREEEFLPRTTSRAGLLGQWEGGWRILFGSLGQLDDADLSATVTIRGEAMPVHEALHRSLAHAASHVGQVVYLAKALRGPDWIYLTIPPGGSDEFNRRLREDAANRASEPADARKPPTG